MAWVGEIDESRVDRPRRPRGSGAGLLRLDPDLRAGCSRRAGGQPAPPRGSASTCSRRTSPTSERMAPWRDAALARLSIDPLPPSRFVIEDRCVAVLSVYAFRAQGSSTRKRSSCSTGWRPTSRSRCRRWQRDERRRAAEDQLRRLSEELEQRVQERTSRELRAANAELEAFNYSLAHESARAAAPLSTASAKWSSGATPTSSTPTGVTRSSGSARAVSGWGYLIDSMLELSRLGRRPMELARCRAECASGRGRGGIACRASPSAT